MLGGHLKRLDHDAVGFVEDFSGPYLDPSRWVDHYLPHWTTPHRSQAHYDLPSPDGSDNPDGAGSSNGLRLRIDDEQLDWRLQDAPLRVSNLQTATFSGPEGSTRGTHRHRPDGLVVRTAVPQRLLWTPSSGQVDITVTASRDRGCMLAVWLVGTEHRDERGSGEICLFEIDADGVTATTTTARVGLKAHHDAGLSTDMTEVTLSVGAGQPHTWSARWGAHGVAIACDQEVVFTSTQVLDYPLQLMVSLFEIGPRDRADAYPKTASVHAVAASRTGTAP